MRIAVVLGIVIVSIFAVVVSLGCELNKSRIVNDFCSFYPEICQYVNFDD